MSPTSQQRPLVLRNSTVAYNFGSREGAGIYGKAGAGISLQNVTIASSELFRPTGIGLRGAGIMLAENARASAVNTLVANNYAASASNPPTPDDIYTAATTSFDLSVGHNLIETTTNCTFTGAATGCIFGQDPQLDPAGLAHHGGATPTLALMANSPAVHVGHAAAALPADQRGFRRNGTPDIGAFEWEGVVPPVPVVGAASRKTHGSAAEFDVLLPFTVNRGVEC